MPPKVKLTPEQLEEKKLLDKIQYMTNRVKGAFSFGHIKTFADILKECGTSSNGYFTHELAKPVGIADVNEYLSNQSISLRVALWLKRNPPIIERDIIDEREKDNKETIQEHIQTRQSDDSNTSKLSTTGDMGDSGSQSDKEEEKEITLELVTDNPYDKDYGWKRSPNESTHWAPMWFQKKACASMLDKFIKQHIAALLLISGTGSGKTVMAGSILRYLLDIKYHVGKTFTPWPYVYITRPSIVEQTKRELKTKFNIDPENEVLVINIEKLRSVFGERFVKQELIIEQGEERVKWIWRKNLYPIFIVWDECQQLKNTDSTQSSIAQSYNELVDPHIKQLFMSATPLTRVAEAKCWCVGSRIPYRFGLASSETPLTNDHWPLFSKEVAEPFDPLEHSPAAVDKLMKKMEDYTERVKGIKPQFRAYNSVEICDFENESDRLFYDEAWERHLAEVAKIKGDEGLTAAQSRFMILVEMLKFRMAAELIHAPDIAKRMVHSVKEGFAACSALNFKGSIIRAVKILVNDYGIPRDKISIIWGGGATAPSKKQKVKSAITGNKEALAALEALGISMEDLDLDDVEDVKIEELDPALRLGPQSLKERQREIDRFQRGESLYCFYTFRAGGVGLSLHHTDEYTKEKVRHKESGYAYEEDIANVSTRPRVNFVAPTYSAMELVQGLGRCPRLTSLSDTRQILLFYKGTIEERVARIVALKLKCLSKVVRQREDWSCIAEDRRIGGSSYEQEEIEKTHKMIENNGSDDEDDSNILGGEDTDGE